MKNPSHSLGAVDWAPWMVLVATVALSFKGIAAKFAYGAGMGVGMLLVLRFVLSVPLFWLGERLVNHGRPQPPLGWREIGACAGAGLLFLAATVCDFSALTFIDAGISRVILFTYPAFILVFQAVERRTWPRRSRLLAFAITYIGLLLVVVPGQGAGVRWEGVVLALGSAVTYALFLNRTQALTQRIGSARFTALANTAVMLCIVPVAPFLGGGWTLDPVAWGWAAVIAVVCTVIPFFFLFEGIRRWGAERAGLLSLLGPAITLALAWLLLDETLSLVQQAGFAVVMAGIFILQRGERRQKKS